MRLAMIGLGRMGLNMARRLIKDHHEVVVYNRTRSKVESMIKEGAIGAFSLEEVVIKLETPRIIWLMLPAGALVDEFILKLLPLLNKGDIIVEGGNGYYKDDIRRHQFLAEKNINYVDAGVSGGIWGLEIGYCTMVGGDKLIVEKLNPIMESLAPKNGYMYCGPSGAGHFVKMIHNGIEYALMESYAEGFEILKASKYSENYSLEEIAKLWNKGSVVRSWLLELLENVFKEDDSLKSIQGYVEDSGEARWTVQEAIENGVSAPAIALSLFKRFQSRQDDTYSNKILAALRREFGGHSVSGTEESVKKSGAGVGEITHAKADENYKHVDRL